MATDRIPLTSGKVRGLTAAANDAGIFTILAVDHRDAMRVVLDPTDPQAVAPSRLTAVKLELIRGLGDLASAVMLDPEYSAGQAIATRTLPGRAGFLAAIEDQGYLGDPTARRTTLLDNWGVEKAKRLGASGIKLLVLYRPDGGAVTEVQDAMIAGVVAECARHDIPLFLEPLAYALAGEAPPGTAEFAARRRRLVVDTVRRLGALGPEVLKVQFPLDVAHEPDRGAWRDACAELDEAAPVPWALLSGGDPYDDFVGQVEIAAAAGASGFMVGRALWGEVVTEPDGEVRSRRIGEELRARFTRLAEVATGNGADWAGRHRFPAVDERWFTTY